MLYIAPVEGLCYTILGMSFMNISQKAPLGFQFIVSAFCLYGFFGCTTLQAKPTFEVGQIYDVAEQNF